MAPEATHVRRQRSSRAVAPSLALIAALLSLISTRRGPRLSPDSVTYLIAARHLREGIGYTDMTGGPLTVFPPLYPLILAPGGDSLFWARVVAAGCAAVAAVLIFQLLQLRVGPLPAALSAVAFVTARGTLWVQGYAWSEGPSLVLILAVLLLTVAPGGNPRRAIAIGGLVGIAVLARYGAIALAPPVVLAVWSWPQPRRIRIRCIALFAAAAVSVPAAWFIRNAVVDGRALGSRSSVGKGISLRLIEETVRAVGFHVAPRDSSLLTLRLCGLGVVVTAAAAWVVLWRRGAPFDRVMAMYGAAALAVPMLARAATSSDIEQRVVSPFFVAAAGLASVGIAVLWRMARPHRLIVLAALVAWAAAGLLVVRDTPSTGTVATKETFSSDTHSAIDRLAPSAEVITNNPWGVAWINHRDPVHYGFVEARPGNSHVPMTTQETLRLVCRGNGYLAWFRTMDNSADGLPATRPDLLAVIDLRPIELFRDGAIFALSPARGVQCPAAS